MTRREQRDAIFKILFLSEFHQAEEMSTQEKLFIEGLSISEDTEDSEYICRKADRILLFLSQIDAALNRTARGWKTSRMAKADLSILRLAVYEMFYDEEIPVNVAINEAVELAKRYGGDESAPFVNGILGVLARKGLETEKSSEAAAEEAKNAEEAKAAEETAEETSGDHPLRENASE